MSAGAESMEVAGGAREADVVVGSVGGSYRGSGKSHRRVVTAAAEVAVMV